MKSQITLATPSLQCIFGRGIRMCLFRIHWHFFRFGTFKFIINTSTLEACKSHKNKIIIDHRQTFINTIDLYFIARLLCEFAVCVMCNLFCFDFVFLLFLDWHMIINYIVLLLSIFFFFYDFVQSRDCSHRFLFVKREEKSCCFW